MEKAKEFLSKNKNTANKAQKTKVQEGNFKQRTYSSSDLSAVFYSMEDIIV